MKTITAQTKTAEIEMRSRLRSSIRWSTSGIVPVRSTFARRSFISYRRSGERVGRAGEPGVVVVVVGDLSRRRWFVVGPRDLGRARAGGDRVGRSVVGCTVIRRLRALVVRRPEIRRQVRVQHRVELAAHRVLNALQLAHHGSDLTADLGESL